MGKFVEGKGKQLLTDKVLNLCNEMENVWKMR